MTQPEGKKECTVTFACSAELKSRLVDLAKYLSFERKGDEITYTQLAHKYVRCGIEKELGRLMLQRHDLDEFLKQISMV